MKHLRYLIEASALYAFFFLCRTLGLDRASALGGWLGRKIGPRLGVSRRARTHLGMALPDLDDRAREGIINKMWDHLGRTVAEYPHLEEIALTRTSVTGLEKVRALKNDNLPGIVFSGHVGNWEILPFHCLCHAGVPLGSVYRRLNNPYANRLLEKIREKNGAAGNHAKSRSGMRQILESLGEGGHIAILIDQKYNEGVTAHFFGHPAMTSPAFVHLAQKFSCPLLPTRCERLAGAHFRMSYFDPLPVKDDAGRNLNEQDVIAAAHALIESWIRERPEQWLWLHRRWKKTENQE